MLTERVRRLEEEGKDVDDEDEEGQRRGGTFVSLALCCHPPVAVEPDTVKLRETLKLCPGDVRFQAATKPMSRV